MFVLDGMPLKPMQLWISHVDCTEQSFPVTPQPRPQGAALPAPEDFLLSSGGCIRGHAYGPGRTPLAGKQVLLAKGWDPFSIRTATTGVDGAA